nr:hypothetical protein [Xanthomonas sp. XNM01]
MLGRKFSDLEREQLPFAIMQACNATAVEIRDVWARTAPRVFDRPVPMTVRAAQYQKATKTRHYATIKLRDEAVGGTPPAKYLLAQVQGGERRKKGFELLLQSKGAMPPGTFTVPGKGAELDAFGNVKARQINQILSQLGARNDKYQNETEVSRKRRRRRGGHDVFALQQKRGNLLPGIYERMEMAAGDAARRAIGVTSRIRSILIFVRNATYKPRFDIFGLAERTWNRLMPFHFNRELQKALESSKYRGRR